MYRGGKRARTSSVVPVVARSRLAVVDPVGAENLSAALTGHVTSVKGYTSALKAWTKYCTVRGQPLFPVQEIFVAAYIIHVCSSISVPSLKVYLAAIRYFQELEGHGWELKGNELVRRALRFVKRKYPQSAKALKFPLSTQVLRAIFPKMHGWPDWAAMSHDDRVVVAATTIAVCAFLRGGEFLIYPGSQRPMLLHEDVSVHDVGGKQAVRVDIAQPKNMWWLQSASVNCFDPGAGGEFGPLKALQKYRELSVVPLEVGGPAFRLANGRALSRNIWTGRISELLNLARLVVIGFDGTEATVKAASARAGGVRSAMDAGVSEPLIMALGRWRSLAWSSYLLQNASDLQRSMEAMWQERAQAIAPTMAGGPSSANAILFRDDDDDLEGEVLTLLANRSAEGVEQVLQPASLSRGCG